MKELRWVTTNKHNSPAAGATQGYMCLFAAVTSNFMTTKIDMQNIKEKYKTGHRYFINLDFDRNVNLTGLTLADTIFDNCCFSVDFSLTDFTNSKFSNCNLKGSNFSESNLKNTIFENCEIKNVEFRNAKIDGTSFTNCHYSGK
jgi:uncharacterized protein YjbI with pentapeptide repeats